MLVMVVNLIKEREEGKGRVDNEYDGKQVDREGMTGCGVYTVREREGGRKRGLWSSTMLTDYIGYFENRRNAKYVKNTLQIFSDTLHRLAD